MSHWSFVSVLGLAGSVTVLVIAALLEPDERGFGTHELLGLPPCSYLAATGHPCMSCGMTTAFASVMHGRPILAWQANPAGLVLCLATLVMPFWFAHSLRHRLDPLRFLQHSFGRSLVAAIALITLAVWLVRNLA